MEFALTTAQESCVLQTLFVTKENVFQSPSQLTNVKPWDANKVTNVKTENVLLLINALADAKTMKDASKDNAEINVNSWNVQTASKVNVEQFNLNLNANKIGIVQLD